MTNNTFLFDIQLADLQQIASVIGIIGYIVFIISVQQSKDQLVLNQTDVNNISTNFQQTAITSIWIRVLSVTILVAILVIKFKERNLKIQAGQEAGPATPNLFITVGLWIMILAIIIIAIGLQEKAQQTVTSIPILS